MSDDSIGTTTGVSAISSASFCTSLNKMLRIGVESGVIFWMLGEQDGVCGGVDVTISISFGGTWISTISVTVVISVCRGSVWLECMLDDAHGRTPIVVTFSLYPWFE